MAKRPRGVVVISLFQEFAAIFLGFLAIFGAFYSVGLSGRGLEFIFLLLLLPVSLVGVLFYMAVFGMFSSFFLFRMKKAGLWMTIVNLALFIGLIVYKIVIVPFRAQTEVHPLELLFNPFASLFVWVYLLILAGPLAFSIIYLFKIRKLF